MRIGLVLAFLLCFCAMAPAETVPLYKLDRAGQTERIASNQKMAVIYRAGLSNALAFAAQQTNLFSDPAAAKPPLPRREEKELLWQAWKSYLDYLLALDVLNSSHGDWWRLSGGQREKSFTISYAAFLAKYRYSVEFVTLMEKNPFVDTILNEPVPELGLPAGTYARLKFRFLNAATATDFGAQAFLYRTMDHEGIGELQSIIDADADFILKSGRGQGELLTAKNALNILKHAGDTAWFPVQAGVSEWMGHTKVHRKDELLISSEQIVQLHEKLLPGDVLLVRREWFLSNIGLPGFWPHAALYVGTPEERRKLFSTPEMIAWVKAQGEASGDFEQLLQARSATNYAVSLQPHEQDHLTRIIEAMSAGVSFTAIEHCANADSLVALRPLLSKTEKATAILRAFHYAGRPYDFNFDFATDSELVCTELVFKSYEPAIGMHGLHLPLEEMLGRQLLPANLIAKQFDEQYGTPDAQFEFISFLDGHEREGKAVESSVEEFRKSWQRPKWHVLTQ
ncbi:MAG TPA: YiiX/YebB-like N1pC/P60 family cysteine hydrolase [Verrucomicrobiae bacterium]|nr:YiiX/YebB-like N1pC/P60 family cysteine hydrolase [Verrucomicrobiae bacterium]